MLHGPSSCQTKPGKSVPVKYRSQNAEQQEEKSYGKQKVSRMTAIKIFVLVLNVNKI